MLLRLLFLCACVSLCGGCSCLFRPYPDIFCGYNILFRGQALYQFEFGMTRYYVVTVNQVFRMPTALSGTQTFIVTTATQSAACGTTLTLNTDYVIAGSYFNGYLTTNLCAPNVPWSSLSLSNQQLLTGGGLFSYCLQRKDTAIAAVEADS